MEFQLGELRISCFFCNIMTFHTFSWFSRIKFIGRWFLYINIWNFPIAVWNFPEGTSGGSWRLPGWTARNHDEGPLAFSQRCLWPSTMINHTWCNHYLVGGWATTLKNMSSSVGMILPNIWKVIQNSCSSQHQPVIHFGVPPMTYGYPPTMAIISTCVDFQRPAAAQTNKMHCPLPPKKTRKLSRSAWWFSTFSSNFQMFDRQFSDPWTLQQLRSPRLRLVKSSTMYPQLMVNGIAKTIADNHSEAWSTVTRLEMAS